jgi:hypothetical protein
MGHHHHADKPNLDEKFVFSGGAKKQALIVLGIGLILTIIGLIMAMNGGGSHDSHSLLLNAADNLASANGGGGGEQHAADWLTRLKANLWINNVFFTGVAAVCILFVAIQYVSASGWSVGVLRVSMSIASFLPIPAGLLIITFFAANHDLFHWTHDYLYDPKSPQYDSIIAGKAGFLNLPFYVGRMLLFIGVWFGLYFLISKKMLAETAENKVSSFKSIRVLSAIFIVFFAVSSSIAAWDWVLSIDTHWFSTMFGWYNFSSWWVTGLAVITITVIFLKEGGYLAYVNENHLHDLGKFVFAFSIFWTYIWFSQFLLIYYANIPEETVYFMERLENPLYKKTLWVALFINFIFPFFVLMTRDSKRKMQILKIACVGVILGHWLDFYNMITPGTLKSGGDFGLLEVGLALVYFGGFIFWVGNSLSKNGLAQKNHPLMEECLHHNI